MGTLLAMTLAALAAYVLSRNRTRFNRAIYLLIIMGIAMPTNFVTLTKVMQWTALINTRFGIVVLYAAMHTALRRRVRVLHLEWREGSGPLTARQPDA